MDHKDLEKLLKLMRKWGVSSLKMPNIELSLGDTPLPIPKAPKHNAEASSPVIGDVPIQTEELSAEDALFWSSTSV